MDSLREQIEDVLIQLDHNYTLPEARDRIIAAFEQVMLQPEVVEGAARKGYEANKTPWWGPAQKWERQPKGYKQELRDKARLTLQAALAAAKGTEGSE